MIFDWRIKEGAEHEEQRYHPEENIAWFEKAADEIPPPEAVCGCSVHSMAA